MKIAKLGNGQRQTIIIGQDLPDLEQSATGNILIEVDESTREQIVLWLKNNTVLEAAEKLGVAKNVVVWLRHELGVSRSEKAG